MKRSKSVFHVLRFLPVIVILLLFSYACSDPFGKYNNPLDPKQSEGTITNNSGGTGTTIDSTTSTAFVSMVPVPAGSFLINQTDATLTVSSFFIGKNDITQAQYISVMGSNPSYFQPPVVVNYDPNLPVENVSWYSAIVFCNKLSIREGRTPVYSINGSVDPSSSFWGTIPTYPTTPWDNVSANLSANGYRLPTFAEWQWAAMGANPANAPDNFSGEDSIATRIAGNYGWFSDNSGLTTHEVGQKIPNSLGLYDMSGNVEQWCWDWYWNDIAPATNETDYQGPSSGFSRVVSGGNWSKTVAAASVAWNGASYVPQYFHGSPPGTTGFRIARSK